MKIAIDASKVNLCCKTGTEKYAYEMVAELLNQLEDEHTVLLYTQEPLPEEISIAHPNISQRVITWRGSGWTLFGLSLALWKDKPDIFYTPASILPLWHPKKSYPVIHGLEYEAFPQAYSFFRFWHLAVFTLLSAKRAEKVIVPSQSTKNDLCQEYNIPEDKVIVVPSGLNINAPSQGLLSEYIKQLSDYTYLFWIGRKESRKNVEMTIDIFDELKPDYPELKLILAGKEGFGYKDIQDRRRKSPYCEDIIEVGFVNEVERDYLYQNAEVFLFPSWYEGFGYPILEAFQAGVPVVTSDSSSLPEVGGDAVRSLPLDGEKDLSQWVRVIKVLLDTPETRHIWIEKGRQRLQEFTLQKSVQKTKKVLLEEI